MFPTNMLYCELPGTTTRSVQFFRNVTEPGNILLLVPATECYNFLAVLGLTINPTDTLLLVWWDSTVIIYGPVQTPLHSCAEPNWWINICTAKERRLNQFGTAVLVRCAKSSNFIAVCPSNSTLFNAGICMHWVQVMMLGRPLRVVCKGSSTYVKTIYYKFLTGIHKAFHCEPHWVDVWFIIFKQTPNCWGQCWQNLSNFCRT